MTEQHIVWEGIAYRSVEACIIKSSEDLTEINSEIVGQFENKSFRLVYTILINTTGKILSCVLSGTLDGRAIHYYLQQTDPGRWTLNGTLHPEFDGCTEVDIPLTPFTNTLAINRLRLHLLQEASISVIYLDVLEENVRMVRQKYKKLSQYVYHYENVPNDFEADIRVDSDGLVIDYPGLFVRIS